MESDVMARVSTGASAGFVLLYTGGDGRFEGRKLCEALIDD
jgi:hypothetical protein